MATLFDIGRDMQALDALLDDVGGELTDPQVDAAVTAWLAELADDEAAKLENWTRYLARLDMEAKAAREQAATYAAMAQARENRVRWMKAAMLRHLQGTGRTRAVTATGRTVSVVGNGGAAPLVVDDGIDLAKVAADWPGLVRTRLELDTAAVRETLAAEVGVPFARLGERGFQLRIK